MGVSKVDAKRRIVLPRGKPGDVFDIQQQADGRYLLVRLETPQRDERISKAECLKAMREAPLRPTMTWEELRKETRET
jgi:bifunctional DNA-binding transcriptional regulator/antitoxin component of YhaV-PrlF toxin-antitoxin module